MDHVSDLSLAARSLIFQPRLPGKMSQARSPSQGVLFLYLLRLRCIRDARIDPSRLPSTDGPNMTKSCRRKASNIKKHSNKHTTKLQKGHNIKIPYKNPLY